jgi:hypothetical protein
VKLDALAQLEFVGAIVEPLPRGGEQRLVLALLGIEVHQRIEHRVGDEARLGVRIVDGVDERHRLIDREPDGVFFGLGEHPGRGQRKCEARNGGRETARHWHASSRVLRDPIWQARGLKPWPIPRRKRQGMPCERDGSDSIVK